MIHVCFGLYDKTGRYSKFTATAMASVFANTSAPVTVHILHDNTLTADNRDKFIYLAGRYGQQVKFHNVEVLCAGKISELRQMFPVAERSRYSIAMFYRFLIPQLLPTDADKCIYLDSDIIVNTDIRDMWSIDIVNKPLAAANEDVIDTVRLRNVLQTKYLIVTGLVARENYFNSGVLLMNLSYLRGDGDNINRGLKFLSEHPQMLWPDQDVLNYLYAADYVKLPERFDVFVDVERTKSSTIRRAIYHYAVQALTPDTRDAFNRLWFDCFIKTPFFDAETFGRLFAEVQRSQIGLKSALVNTSTFISGKTRVFFDIEKNRDALGRIFSIRPDEDFIIAEDNSSLQKLIDAMRAAGGRKLFFIMLPNFPFQTLIQAGFVHGRDFVNGLEFLSEAQGVPTNYHSLVAAM